MVRLMTPSTRRPAQAASAEHGFTLIEVMIAMLVLTVGVLSLVGVAAAAVQRATESSPALIAREKAREAIESVHSARDTGELSWAKVQNVGVGTGMFLAGDQPLKLAGPDGLVNTADDTTVETIRSPGADKKLNTSDDQVVSLTDFKRNILIEPLNYDGTNTVNPNLRKITVTIKYRLGSLWRDYVIVTYISSYS
jgi:prepilin-type N-terminal cleavage/methylation domain-containing protein